MKKKENKTYNINSSSTTKDKISRKHFPKSNGIYYHSILFFTLYTNIRNIFVLKHLCIFLYIAKPLKK